MSTCYQYQAQCRGGRRNCFEDARDLAQLANTTIQGLGSVSHCRAETKPNWALFFKSILMRETIFLMFQILFEMIVDDIIIFSVSKLTEHTSFCNTCSTLSCSLPYTAFCCWPLYNFNGAVEGLSVNSTGVVEGGRISLPFHFMQMMTCTYFLYIAKLH